MAAPVPTGDVIAFSWERNHEVGPFDSETIKSLNLLASHLQRAALVAGRLGLEKSRAAAETMSAIGLPTAVLTHANRLLLMNDLFEPFVPTVVQDRQVRVTFTDSRADAQFEQIVCRMRSGHLSSDQVQSMPVAARKGRPPMVAHVIPIRRKAEDVFSSASNLLVITALESGVGPESGLIQGLFDLTPAEARVAQAVAAGSKISEIARKQGVSPETVRTQMKAIFGKTGTSRQAELVILLSGAVL